ncbi:amidase [uncultured Tolumonas sp.]|uniref:amidase n=1 Tax=uncultured Tolumonas sp. TaxID=263765 RepID=UPI002A0A560A|nr:amidase [uncultured Tolumonas sp.]
MADFSVYCPHGPHNFRTTQEGALSDLRLVYKDLYHVAGFPTGAGNPTWLSTHEPAAVTSPVLLQLMNAGMQVIGRVQTDELAYSLNGCNVHFGTPMNPVTPDRLPGGSSSGCAVAVARGEADVGLGTDTGGSIRVPACYNGLYGIRPTHGRLPTSDMVPLAPCFDTPGWLCRDAKTLERVGAVIFQSPPEQPPSLNFLWADQLFAMLPALLLAAVEPIRVACQAIATKTDSWTFSAERLAEMSQTFRTVQGREITRTHFEWVKTRTHAFAKDIAERFLWAATLTEAEEVQAKRAQAGWKEEIDAVLEQSFLILPTTPDLAPLRTASDADLADFRMKLLGLTALAGLAGLPQVHLPLVKVNGVPYGCSIIGKRGSDMTLLAIARLFSDVMSEV